MYIYIYIYIYVCVCVCVCVFYEHICKLSTKCLKLEITKKKPVCNFEVLYDRLFNKTKSVETNFSNKYSSMS
jgi:hypothetical protein